MDSLQAYYYLNTNILVVKNARSQLMGGGILNDAIGTATLRDKNNQSLPGGGPISLTYVPASQGQYQAIFPSTVPTVVGQFVSILIELNGGVNLVYRGIINARVMENG